MKYPHCGALLALMAALLCATAGFAMPFEPGQRDFSLVAGYGVNYRFPSPVKTRIRFDQASLRWGRFISPTTDRAFELGLGSQVGRKENVIVSALANQRHYFVVAKNTALGYDLAFGAVHFEDSMPGMGTRLNFTEQVGLVVQQKVGADSALTLQYRFSHTSNGGIKKPNVGMNASVVSLGFTWFL